MKLRHTWGWIAPLALALLAVASLALVPATQSAAAGASPITVPFDHLTTGFELDGVHRDLPCESCHLNAVFRGTPRNCGTCHIKGSLFNATPKTQTHVLTSNNCAACHNTISFRPQVHFDHAEAMGSCVSCHNGIIATGKGPTHPATSDNCAACHTVMSWNPPSAVDHTQIPLAVAGFCIICHNGSAATGKNKGHIATSLECGDCHLTTTWLGANFDHTGITSGCASCHNGTKAVGKQGNHMPTTNLCESCHTTGIGTKTPSWVPSKFDHTQMTTVNTCLPCHNGTVKITTGIVSGLPVSHVPLSSGTPDCILCHGNNPAAETWTVLAADIPTLHTKLNTGNCLLCHGGQTFAGVPAPFIPMSISGVSPYKKAPLAPPHIPVMAGTDCSACHGPAYRAGGFGPATAMSATTHQFVSTTCDTCHDTGKSFYVGSGTPLQLRPADHVNSNDPRMATSDCSVCHTTKDWISTAMPVGHMPNPSNLSCLTCHTKSPSDYTPATLAANSVLHTGITGNCGLCHGDNVSALTWANNYTPKDALLTPPHIPYLSGTDCSSCHTSGTYAVGTFGPMNMTPAKHAFVPTACNTCHEKGLSYFMGAANPALQGRPADHNTGQMVAPNDCSICHTTANWNSNALPVGHMPNPGNAACTVCHTDVTNYKALASIPVLHTGVTGGCGTCHGATTVLTWYNNYVPKDALLTPSHIPYLSGADCSSCHTPNYVAGGFGPTNMSATKHAFVPTTCDTCHEAGMTFYLGASTPALQGRPASHLTSTNPQEKTGDCSGCHNTMDWTTTAKPVNHMPTPGTQTCSVCHTAIGSTEASYAALASVPVLHTGITGNCGQCHGNYTAALTWYNAYTPKDAILTPLHIPYLVGTDCSSCHAPNYTTGGFGPTNMSAAKHAFVPTTCKTCHETGSNFYLGASTPALQTRPTSGPNDHIHNPSLTQMIAGDCSQCHNTTVWTTPKTLPGGHMPIPGTQDCTVCHTATASGNYNAYASIPVLHTGITTGCAQCHGGATPLTFYNNHDNPKAAPSNHIPSFNNNDCSACHKANYAVGGFGPMIMTQATHTNVSTTACKTCHEAGLSFYMGMATPGLQGRPADHTTAAMAAPNDCAGCHTTANWNSNTMPAGHMPNPANTACNVCHITAPASYKTLAINSILHTGISGNCGLCHGGTAGALTWYNAFTPKAAVLAPAHIPYLAGTDCSGCHSSSTYAAGTFGPMNMTQAKHSFVPTSCNTCHEKGLSFYMGAANPGLQGRPADHTSAAMSAPNDCGGCHTTANWNSNTLPAGHMPNPANDACTVCHINTANYKILAANSVLHTGISSNCGQCHGGTTPLTWYNAFTPKAAVLSPAHIPYLAGADCSSCHSSSTYAAGTFGPSNMTQARHAFVTTNCVTCHEKGVSFYMGAANPALQGRPADHTSGAMLTGNCGSCHTTANWNSTSGALPAGHMPNPGNQGCSVCHIAAPANYKTLAANAVLHTGIGSGCITCHAAPNAAPLVFYLNFRPKAAAGLAPPHIPTSSTPCESCHTISFTSFSGTTMSAAKHTTMLSVTGGTCDQCHGPNTLTFYGVNNLTTRPGANHGGGKDCNGCHSPNSWNGGKAKKTVAAAKTPTRSTIGTVVAAPAAPSTQAGAAPTATPQTRAAQTATPRVSVSRAGAIQFGRSIGAGTGTVSHAGVTSNCASCHNGVLAAGKTPTHIASNNTCQNCHTTIAWLPARFDHQGVTARCASCHNGVVALGKPRLHVQTNQDCGACHGTITWTAVRFSHVGISAMCQSCHNGITATGKQVQHVRTTLDCGSCHNTLNWTIVNVPARPRPLIPSPRGAPSGPTK
jgi:nitrate/TMAO reductase-like tetraheme cytochrome c subunit